MTKVAGYVFWIAGAIVLAFGLFAKGIAIAPFLIAGGIIMIILGENFRRKPDA